jgi:hypothetical protein
VDWGEIDMMKDLSPPTEAEEYRNMAEIFRDLAAQVRSGKIRDEIVHFADNLDRLAAFAEPQSGPGLIDFWGPLTARNVDT